MLNNPSQLYSGAAQVFNNAPHLAFQARLLQQYAAKRDALDAYFKKLPLTINEKGVRDAERPDIAKSALGLKEYYLQNREALKSGDQATAYNYEKMFRDHQDLVTKSQTEGLTGIQLGKLFMNPKTSYVADNKDFMDKVHAHSLSVNDPNHVSMDLEEILLPPKPFDRTEYFKDFTTLKGNDNKTTVNNPNGTQTVTNNPSYGDEQKGFVMQVAADKYLHNTDGFRDMVNTDLGAADASNPLNADFKQHFGHDIQTPIDLATAYTFSGLKPQPITEKIQIDPYVMLGKRQAFSKEQQARQFAHSNALQRRGFEHADIKGKIEAVEGADAVLNDIYDKISQGEKTPVLGMFGEKTSIIPIADAGTMKLFTGIRKVGTTPVPVDVVTFDKSKKQFNLEYNSVTYKDDAGKMQTIPAATIPLSEREYLKLKVKDTYPNKDIGEINNIIDKIITKNGGLYSTIKMYDQTIPKVAAPKPATKSKTKKDPLGLF